MDSTDETPEPPPNGPARVTIDNKKERFKLDYGGEIVFQAAVKLVRDGKAMTFKEAGARLFVLSKFDGWDVVTQTVRVAAVGALPGDILSVSGACPVIDTATETEIANDLGQLPCVYCSSHDWLLSIDEGPATAIAFEDVPIKGTPDSFARRIAVACEGSEIMLRFRPYYRKRHDGGGA